jgi:hypothetical protein
VAQRDEEEERHREKRDVNQKLSLSAWSAIAQLGAFGWGWDKLADLDT